MKKLFTLIILLVVSFACIAQDTRCTNVVYHSTYYWSSAKLDFVHAGTTASTLTFCMSENHLQLNNEAGTYIILTKTVGKYVNNSETDMCFEGTDRFGKRYTITYIFRDSGPYYMRMQVNIVDVTLGLRSELYLNPF